jgi:hypothetical protein
LVECRRSHVVMHLSLNRRRLLPLDKHTHKGSGEWLADLERAANRARSAPIVSSS